MICKREFRFSLKQTLSVLVTGESLNNHNGIKTDVLGPRTFRLLGHNFKSGGDCLTGWITHDGTKYLGPDKFSKTKGLPRPPIRGGCLTEILSTVNMRSE